MSFPVERRTERLLLRTWRESDLDGLAAVLGDAEVMRYMWGEPRTIEESREALERRTDHWERHGFGFWAAESLSTGELMGWVGLQYAEWLPELSSEVEIGWMLARAHWGQGLASEGAAAALEAGFESLRLKRIVGLYHPDNVRSRRVMEKLGMRYVGETTDPRDGDPMALRDITREAWELHRIEYASGND